MAFLDKLLGLFKISPAEQPPEDAVSAINSQLVFQNSELLTIGVECELGLVDAGTFEITHTAAGVINKAASKNIKVEHGQHMIEVTTGVCQSIQQVEIDLRESIEKIKTALPDNTKLIGTGSLPLLDTKSVLIIDNERCAELKEKRQILYERFATQGMHMHLGMSNAHTCIRFQNFYMHLLPHFIALSASSPFENGYDTGLDSIRLTITESLPVAGIPYQFKNWQDYKDICNSMARCGSIRHLKDLCWDIRPCPHYGTLEIRIFDQPATLAEVSAIAAFVHCLGHWFNEHQDWLDEMPRPSNWRMRENKWRAMRYGLDADLVINNSGDTKPIRADIENWHERLKPFYDRLGYGRYGETLLNILAKGNGASRQRHAFRKAGTLQAVYALAIHELEKDQPIWDGAPENDMSPKKEYDPLAKEYYPTTGVY